MITVEFTKEEVEASVESYISTIALFEQYKNEAADDHRASLSERNRVINSYFEDQKQIMTAGAKLIHALEAYNAKDEVSSGINCKESLKKECTAGYPDQNCTTCGVWNCGSENKWCKSWQPKLPLQVAEWYCDQCGVPRTDGVGGEPCSLVGCKGTIVQGAKTRLVCDTCGFVHTVK